MQIKNYHEAMEALYPSLSDYLESQGIDTTKHFSCISPDHDDANPSCSIAPSGNAFHCFSCGVSGGIFHAAHFLEGKSMVGQEFIQDNLLYLAEKYNVEVESEPLTEEQLYELDTYRAYRAASDFIVDGTVKTELYTTTLKERQWDSNLATEFGIGCIYDYKKFRQYLKGLGFSASFLNDIDLSRTDIFGEDKLVFTIRDHHGRPVGFSSRNLSYTEDKEHGAKYCNQRGTGVKCNIYKKSTRLYGFDLVLKNAKKKPKPVYIFEGYSDVISAAKHGLHNCVAIGGTSLTLDQLYLLKDNNYYEIILCLDGDIPGQKRTAELLDNVLSGHKDLRVKIVVIPASSDPDQFIRENGVEEFKKLKKWTAFEWRLAQFAEDTDVEEISASMIPLIVNETSYVSQEKMCEVLAKATGLTLKTVQQELNRLQDQKEAERSRDRQQIIDKLIRDCQREPAQAEFSLQEATTKFFDLARRFEEDGFSEDACLALISSQKAHEEQKDGSFSGFILGPELASLEKALCGEWKKDVWLCIGGKPNSGKTSFMCKLLYEVGRHITENNACVIYHTIDDTAEQVLPKFISIAEGSRTLSLNQITDPQYHANHHTDEDGQQDIFDRREVGYNAIMNMVRTGRLVIKDANQGNSIAYADRLISYYKTKYPDRNIVYVLDNFHKLQDFATLQGDERGRFKQMSTVMKGLATRHHVAIITTVEYRKTQNNQRAGNQDISETVQIEYDANLIAHIHNDLHDKGDRASFYHYEDDEDGTPVKMPTVELEIGKNKITAFKNKLFFDFYPGNSDFVSVDEEIIRARIPADNTVSDFGDQGPFSGK